MTCFVRVVVVAIRASAGRRMGAGPDHQRRRRTGRRRRGRSDVRRRPALQRHAGRAARRADRRPLRRLRAAHRGDLSSIDRGDGPSC